MHEKSFYVVGILLLMAGMAEINFLNIKYPED